MNWIWIEQRANLQDKCLPRESSNLSETRHIFHDENFRFLSPSLSRPKIIAFESKITGREVFQFDEFCERESRKVRYEFSIKFLERSPNISFPIVKRWTAFLEKLFHRNACISPRSSASRVFLSWPKLNRNRLVWKFYFRARYLSTLIASHYRKILFATDERDEGRRKFRSRAEARDFYARNLDKGKIRSRVGNKMLERKLRGES